MRDAYTTITAEGYVVLGISVETNLSYLALAQYADRHDFAWRFAVATSAFLEAVVAQYGSQAIVPPNAPHFVLSAAGELGPLRLGVKSGDELLSELRAAG